MTDRYSQRQHQDRLHRLDRVAGLLDTRFRVPVIGIRFGWDSIVGLVPGLGDLITVVPGAWMIYEAAKLGVRRRILARMAINTGVDFVVGGVPVLGDAFDLFFKSHRRNMALVRSELNRPDGMKARENYRGRLPGGQRA
ncbi:DUF4112 domain-containing protein [Amaricoccus tamworthensis]|uniref:DUF4112 domain-containing protein n=1 Tax=Amaricoccus tamworthensis TaxID=57002 RepID=UPI003C7D57E0